MTIPVLNDSVTQRPDPRRWIALAVLALAQFMVVLDVTIVNVALPAIRDDLGFSDDGLQWVVNAYVLTFGGLLLLGGRVGDVLGRRRTFVVGLALFCVASLAGGLAPSPGALVAARAVQGIGAALLSPAALALVTVAFPAGRERNIALGVWGALAGLGGTVGVIVGGVLVDAVGWEWILFVNVPIGLAVALAVPRALTESRDPAVGGGFDVAGAVLGTAGITSLVLGVIRSEPAGWGSAEVLGLLAASAALLAAFVAVESRATRPLVPLELFRSAGMRSASIGLALNGATFLGMFFLSALYLQNVLGDSALEAGLHFLPMGIAAIVSAVAAGQAVTRWGTRPVFVAGSLTGAAGLFLLSRAGADASYWADVAPGFVVFGLAIPWVGTANQIAAVAEVRHQQAGAASGVVTAAFQIGGAVGLAVITTLANGRAEDAAAGGAAQVEALASGFERGLLIAAVLALVNVAVALAVAPRLRPDAATVAEASAAA